MQKSPHMNRLILGVVIGALLALARPALADFAAGVAAYDNGDYATAFAEWLPLAETGDPAAQRNIGHLYRKGQGVEQDLDSAVEWYRRAAEVGFARAQANLASMYLRGDGVPQDYAEAAKWFERAAIQGHDIAQYNLALMYERGLGVEQSEPKALAWYYNAARAGHKKAADRLGTLVISPTGDSELPDQAVEGGAALPAPAPEAVAGLTLKATPGDGASASDQQSIALATPDSAPAGEPAVAAPTAVSAPAAASEWQDPDLARAGAAASPAPEGGETALGEQGADEDEGAAAEDEAAAEDDEPSKANAFLRFLFGFNNDILIGRTGQQSPSATSVDAPSEEEAGDEEPVSSLPGDEGPAAERAADQPATGDGEADEGETQGAASAPALDQEVPIATAAPQPAATEPLESAASEASAVASLDTAAPATSPEPDLLLRWVMLLGAQSSGDLERGRDRDDEPAAASSPAAGANGSDGGVRDHSGADDERIVPPPAAPASETLAPPQARQETSLPPLPVATVEVLNARPPVTVFEADAETLLPLAQAGDADAQYALGRVYFEGSSVPPDELQAYLWFALSAEQNHGEAARALRRLADGMDGAQIAAGEVLVDNLKDHR